MAATHLRVAALLLLTTAGCPAVAQEADEPTAAVVEFSQSLTRGNLAMCGLVFRGVVASQSYREGKMLAIVGSINASRPPGKVPAYYLKAQLYELGLGNPVQRQEIPIEMAYLTLPAPKFSTAKLTPDGFWGCDSGLGYCGAFTASWEVVWGTLGTTPAFSIFVTPKGASLDIGIQLRPDWDAVAKVYDPNLPVQVKLRECMKQMTDELRQELGAPDR